VEGEEEFFDPSYYNEEEARTVKTLLEDLIDEFNYPKEWFSIITPYQG
jgi:superfamily I DNA and/or RNA helicase